MSTKENLAKACKEMSELLMTALNGIASKRDVDSLIAECTKKLAVANRLVDAALLGDKQPVVVLLEDQGEIVDVVGPFDTPEQALTWSAYQQSEEIAPVGMKFLIRGVSEPGPGLEPTYQVVDFGLGPTDQTQGYPFEGSEADCSQYVTDHQETRADKQPRLAIQPIPEDEGLDSDQFAISKEGAVRQQGLEADLAERDRQEDQPPFE